ncbi:MAG: ABC transporter ATP-binding protein [Alphaproteobacteria bacterium]
MFQSKRGGMMSVDRISGLAGDLIVADALTHDYPASRAGFWSARNRVRAIDNVSFVIAPGDTLGLVGESGSGKSTIGRIVLGMMAPSVGQVSYKGDDIYRLSGEAKRRFRRRVQMIFQDPLGNLDPRMRVGEQIREALDIHREGSPADRRARVEEMLESVGLDPKLGGRFPHQLSGGQQQRVVIARAVILNPELIICDEPVSALDVSVQAQVLNLMADLQKKLHLSYLFISHDLAIIRHLCNRVAVLYLGRIMEIAPTERLFSQPQHPYTKALMASVPVPDPEVKRSRAVLRGDPPDHGKPISGCRFHARCSLAFDRCRIEEPALSDLTETHASACHLAKAAE